MRYEQAQIDKFLAEARTTTMDILELSKKHGIHSHTGNKWVRKYLAKKEIEKIHKRGQAIRAEHAAATRIANNIKRTGTAVKNTVRAGVSKNGATLASIKSRLKSLLADIEQLRVA